MKLIDRIKALTSSIGADIKSIKSKTDLLKTAAYKDVGTDSGNVVEFDGVNGVGGFGLGGVIKRLGDTEDLNELRFITAQYGGVFKPINFPIGQNLSGFYVLDVLVTDSGVKQTLTMPKSRRPDIEIIIYERIYLLGEWSDWLVSFDSTVSGQVTEPLVVGSNLDALPRKNAIYSGKSSDGILGLPAELSTYIFDYSYIVETLASKNNDSNIQRLTLNLFTPAGTSTTNTVVYLRSTNYSGFSSWLRISGKIYGLDAGGDVVGDDIEVNSIKAGALSPKIGFESVIMPFTYENFGYQADGISKIEPDYDLRGVKSIASSHDESRILSISCRAYYNRFGSTTFVKLEDEFTDAYYRASNNSGNTILVYAMTELHAQEVNGETSKSGQLLFDLDGYVELFVIYKVD